MEVSVSGIVAIDALRYMGYNLIVSKINLEGNPKVMALEVGAIVSGLVTGITNFGAFVELETGQTGLVHISEVADAYVKDINDYLKMGERIRVKVINVDGRGKIGLSIRQARRRPTVSLDDQLARFMKDSEERLSSLRKNTDSKRGGRGGYAPGSARQSTGRSRD